jgi:hypothetical protein
MDAEAFDLIFEKAGVSGPRRDLTTAQKKIVDRVIAETLANMADTFKPPY